MIREKAYRQRPPFLDADHLHCWTPLSGGLCGGWGVEEVRDRQAHPISLHIGLCVSQHKDVEFWVVKFYTAAFGLTEIDHFPGYVLVAGSWRVTPQDGRGWGGDVVPVLLEGTIAQHWFKGHTLPGTNQKKVVDQCALG